MTDETIDTLLKIIYIDPLIEDAVINYTDTKSRWEVVLGDELMHPYIQMIDEEIFSDPPMLTPNGVDEWNAERLGDMSTQLMDKARTHGWAIVQFYTTGREWRVFSEDDRVDWIYTDNEEIIGAKVTLEGTTTSQVCVWGFNQCYLLKWREGDGKKEFAYPDISQALWTAATITRQIRNQLDIMCAKPEFPWVKYGDNVTPNQRTAILNSLDDASITCGIGASENAVMDIKMIPHQSFAELSDAIDQRTKKFAGLTRLPYAFYNGERGTGGLNSADESGIEMQIDRKKQHIFNKIKALIEVLYLERYSITLTEIAMDTNEVEPVENNTTLSPSDVIQDEVEEEIQDE